MEEVGWAKVDVMVSCNRGTLHTWIEAARYLRPLWSIARIGTGFLSVLMWNNKPRSRPYLSMAFSKLVTSDTSFDAYVRGMEYGVDLPQPIIDRTNPPPSFQRTDQLLLSHGIVPSELSDEQKATFQSQSPAVQQKSLEIYKAQLARTAER